MQLTSLSIDNFKNIRRARLEFSSKINGLLGNNGMGKSNLLDAIHTLSFCKSFTGVTDAMLITRDEDFAMLKGNYLRRDTDEDLTMGLARGRRKTLKRKGKEYQRLSEHIGTFPLVMVSPADIDLIREGAEERRKLIDMVISQSDPRYLDALIRYGRALEQRNRMLREGTVDHTLYDAVEMAMEMSASYIVESRREWVSKLTPIFERHYRRISGGNEMPQLNYSTRMADGVTLAELLDRERRHDEIVRHTSVGPHRDDLELTLDGMEMRRTGSQGQCKTFTIALRLAQYEFLGKATGMRPLLLLDDIFDKLDADRVERIMEIVEDPAFGQIFITDTNRTHLDEIVNRTAVDFRLWEVTSGNFSPIGHQ
ncbi:MAG: DNA replication and repair protein RecF [Muribaculaceae bacterium]|jgi:DNA replication and repair protein RecF|nr:DNA replication and repair protein RecF [Muribaculaceae bacterium]